MKNNVLKEKNQIFIHPTAIVETPPENLGGGYYGMAARGHTG